MMIAPQTMQLLDSLGVEKWPTPAKKRPTDRAEQAHNGEGRPITGQSTRVTRDPLKGVVRPTKEADKATLQSTAHECDSKSLERTIVGTFYHAPRELGWTLYIF